MSKEFHDGSFNTQPTTFTERGWKLVILSQSNYGKPEGEITDPLGNVQRVQATFKTYKGVIELHQLLKFVAQSPNWLEARL